MKLTEYEVEIMVEIKEWKVSKFEKWEVENINETKKRMTLKKWENSRWYKKKSNR